MAIQSNNVETDERGYVYVVDRTNTGLHILEMTGPGARLQGFQKTDPAFKVSAVKCVAAINVEIKLCRVALFLIIAACLQPVGLAHASQADSIWIETKWPFLMDQWGEGRSFQCKAADCGAELNLYIRAKIGFCSSTTGVADDNAVERLSDFDFMKGQATALGSGREIDIAGMKGRLRTYATASSIFSTDIRDLGRFQQQ